MRWRQNDYSRRTQQKDLTATVPIPLNASNGVYMAIRERDAFHHLPDGPAIPELRKPPICQSVPVRQWSAPLLGEVTDMTVPLSI